MEFVFLQRHVGRVCVVRGNAIRGGAAHVVGADARFEDACGGAASAAADVRRPVQGAGRAHARPLGVGARGISQAFTEKMIYKPTVGGTP